jgi:ABC-type sugar transport system substrate-binding protein
MAMRTTRGLCAAFVLAATLGVAACGGGGSGNNNSSDKANGSDVARTGSPTDTSATPGYLGSFAPREGLGGTVPKKTIGLVNVIGSNGNAAACQANFEQAAKDLGWEVKTIDAQGDPAKMASGVSTMVTQKVDAIVTVSIEPSVARQGLTAAKSAGIPAISICGALAPPNLYDAVYAPNDNALSATVVRYMIDDLPAGSSVVAQFYDPIAALKRRDVVTKALLKDAGMPIVATHQVDLANGVQDVTKSSMDMLRAHPDAKAIILDQNFEFTPVVNAIKQANMDVKVYGMYGDPDSYKTLREGGPARAFSNSTSQWSGWMAADALLTYFVNKKKIDPLGGYLHPFPMALLTSENVTDSDLEWPDIGPFYLKQWKAEGFKF